MRDIDPELKYCPKCQDEFLAHIIECAICDVELITGRQVLDQLEARRKKLESRSLELSPEDDLVTIRRGKLPDMQYLAQVLEKEKIGSVLIGDMTSCAKDRFGNTRSHPSVYEFQVKRQDVGEALHFIEIEHRKETHLDHHEKPSDDSAIYNPNAPEAKCPACGHVFPTTENECPDCGLGFGE